MRWKDEPLRALYQLVPLTCPTQLLSEIGADGRTSSSSWLHTRRLNLLLDTEHTKYYMIKIGLINLSSGIYCRYAVVSCPVPKSGLTWISWTFWWALPCAVKPSRKLVWSSGMPEGYSTCHSTTHQSTLDAHGHMYHNQMTGQMPSESLVGLHLSTWTLWCLPAPQLWFHNAGTLHFYFTSLTNLLSHIKTTSLTELKL